MRKCPKGNILHARMHWKSGRYWYVYRNKWHPLAREYPLALQQYTRELTPTGGMLKLVAETYRAYENRVAKGTLSPRSLRAYKLHRERIETAFVEFAPEQVKSGHIGSFLDFYYEDKPNAGNICLAVLTSAFTKAVRWGLCEYNPAAQVKRFETTKRDRYLSDDEYQAIYRVAPAYLKLVMDMCYLTGQRIGDVLHIKQADISQEGIYFEQGKSKKRLAVESTPELLALVKEARGLSKVAGVYLFARSASYPMHYETVRRHFAEARDKAGVEDARIHDIRAKSLTDADRQGEDAQRLAGHSSAGMTERYLRLRRTEKVRGPVAMRAKP